MTSHGVATARRGHARRRVTRRRWRLVTDWSIRRFFVAVIAVAGVAVLLYPSAAAWFSDRVHAGQVAGYVRDVRAMRPERITRELAQAHQYDDELRAVRVADPLAAPSLSGPAVRRYDDTLDVGPLGIMGVVQIPAIGLSLPVYHGTAADTLDRGVGHVYGTALPVGGPGTHSVLAGHSGVVGSTLFSHLRDVRLGDTFTITVLDQVLTYRVDQIRTVLPAQTKSLGPVPGEDYVTLVTCTPIGVNTHRLLVRGVRVPTTPDALRSGALAGVGGAGFPWWVLIGISAAVVILLVTSRLTDAPGPRRSQR